MGKNAIKATSADAVRAGVGELRMRPTVPEDLPGIWNVIRSIYHSYGCIFDPEREDTYLLNPGPYFRDSGGEFWVVDNGKGVVATGAVYLHADAGELKKLYVDPSVRCMGWGRRLTQAAIDHARAAGKRRMFLWSDVRFRDAHRLYRRMGFREFGLKVLGDLSDSTEFGFEMDLDSVKRSETILQAG